MREGMERVARVFKALAHPTRLAVVALLEGGERCVCEIHAALGLEQPNVSQHLTVMRLSGVLTCRRDGMRTFYSLASPKVLELLGTARELAGFAREAEPAVRRS